MLAKEQSLPIMKDYDVSYMPVFTTDDLQKFGRIAKIAGFNATDYLTKNGDSYQPTTLGSQATSLRLLFDDTLHPDHFSKLYDNGRGKIYQVECS